ncbi:MAG: hypothetical protein WBL25_18675 [Anaerolineales bacterium]
MGLYLLLALRYPLVPSLDDPRASWASMVDGTWSNAAYHLTIYLGLILLYLVMLRLLTPSKVGDKTPPQRQILFIIATWLVCSATLMFVAPAGESHDIFDYLFRGRMMTEYQANPLVDVPEDFKLATPYSRYLAWRKYVDTYGPVWEASSAAVASSVHQVTDWLGWWVENYPNCPNSRESCRLLIAYITGYRLLAISLTGLSGWLIYSMVRRSQASLAPLALAAWLLSPMTLIATAVGGHNDAVMLVLVLLSWWLLQRQRPFLAMLALIVAAHVKLTALIWLPACALWIVWRWGWARALKIGLASITSGLALSWLLYAPFGGWQTLPRMLNERSEFFANSVWRILYHQLIYGWGWSSESAQQLSTGLPNWLFGMVALIIPLWLFNFRPKRWRTTSAITPAEADRLLWLVLTAISMSYLLIGSFWFQHWYVLWVLAPAVLLPDSRFTRSILPWLVFSALSSNAAMSFLLVTALENAPRIVNYIAVVVIIWGPLLIALSALVFSRQLGKRKFKIHP